jgi:murein DD-endopeptidase MepM/ murein hydrolase activator NlpD
LVLLLVVGMVAGAVLAAAFGGDHRRAPAVQVELLGTTVPTQTSNVAGTTSQPKTAQAATPNPTPVSLSGFAYPIAGGCLPQNDDLMPGAPRQYRNGIHEGMDFYDSDNCTSIGLGTEVLAAKPGTIIRADSDYHDLTAAEISDLEARARFNGSDPQIEDAFRGRQVWVDHGNGIVTRYAHLSGIADGIEMGKHVNQGELIAYVGESGTPESVTDPGTQYHLHFEVRVGDTYLGEGLQVDEVRRLYDQVFSP